MSNRIQERVDSLAGLLKSRKWKLTTAESCTGGGLSYCLTAIPGSSNWFDCGFITYSNASKEKLLGVSPDTLRLYGSVSEETAREMAAGALENSQAHISVAITGIAGPDGGSPEKPVGTVWIALLDIKDGPRAFSMAFSGDRDSIREQAIVAALDRLLEP